MEQVLAPAVPPGSRERDFLEESLVLPRPPPEAALKVSAQEYEKEEMYPIQEQGSQIEDEEEDESSDQADIEKVYAFRDAIAQGLAEKKKIKEKADIVEFFLSAAVEVSAGDEKEIKEKLVPVQAFESLLTSLDIDPREESVVWITSHFKMLTKENKTYADPVAMLHYLQLTPQAEKQSQLASLSDMLCEGATELGIQTKEELCAFLTNREKCISESTEFQIDLSKVHTEAKILAKCCEMLSADDNEDLDDTDLVPERLAEADCVRQSEFWTALTTLNPQLDPVHSVDIAQLIESVYSNEDGTIDAIHLLHDLKLWPGVSEQEHWNSLADTLRDLLIDAASQKNIDTKEALCTLFADDEGRPLNMPLQDFLQLCQDQLGLDLRAISFLNNNNLVEDENNDSELIPFLRCFLDDDDNIDLGDLLSKIMLWPGSEEEHRALIAGRALRQQLISAAEKHSFENIADLWAHLVDRTGNNDSRYLPLDSVLNTFKTDFDIPDSNELSEYLRHFVSTDSKLDMKKLFTHLELFTQDEDDFQDQDDDELTHEQETVIDEAVAAALDA